MDFQVRRVSGLVPCCFFRHLFAGKAYARIGLLDRAIAEFTLFQNFGFRNHPDILNDIGCILMNIGK